jgi:tetratricopeptide (TPR) repeat protein
MAINPGAQQRQLKDAADALKKGNRVRARDVLLRVIQKDRDDAEAWWLLYQALDEATGQARALENVLRLDPQHEAAQQALIDARQKKLAVPPAEQFEFIDAAALDSGDGDLDDQYQCPYCGQHTGVDDRRCPHCRGGLFVRVPRSAASSGLRLVVLLLGISLAAGVIEMIGPALALGAAQGSAGPTNFRGLLAFPAVALIFGNFLALTRPVALLLLQIYSARAGLLAATLLSVRGRWRLGFYSGLVAMLADLLLSVYLLVNGHLGVGGAVFNSLLALAIGTLLAGLSDEFAISPQRLLVKPVTTARSAADFYKIGHDYRKRGMWAMAVAQWRKAVGLAPQTAQYYKHLGIGYAQIKRYTRSLRALEEGRRQAPEDREIAEVMALVRAQADTHGLLTR